MDHQQWRELDAIFSAAAELEGEARAALLADRCAGRPDLRAQVESLLMADDRGRHFLESPAVALATTTLSVCPGSVLGAWRLIELIGEGGMATVYRAERVDGAFEQQVALKIARTLLRDEESTRRFKAERQILAALRHPHIVTLLDGGTLHDDQPYLVMELVDGTPITIDCRDRARPLDARLRLFIDVCAAVQYAHSHGVVHRDLKPANILVTREDVVKVLDFGVAKLLDPHDGPKPIGATTGLPVPMTPNYASPEQLRGIEVTTASDVYALGVVLYELIAGQRPYETHGLPLDEILTIVLDTTPRKPSTRTSTSPGGNRLPADLDAIVLKALSKEPTHRYASAGELADDVRRLLASEPVLAHGPSTLYTVRKLANGHRFATIIALMALLGVLTALGLALRERARAERSFANVRRIANTVIFDLNEQLAGVPGATPVRRRLIQEAVAYLEQIKPDAARDPALQVEIGRGYRKLGQLLGTRGTDNLGDGKAAIANLRQARELLKPMADVPAVAVNAVDELITVNGLLANTLQAEEGGDRVDLVRESLAYTHMIAAGHEDDPRRRRMLAMAEFWVASVIKPSSDSLPHWLQAQAIYNELLAQKPDDTRLMADVALTSKNLAEVLLELHRNEEAEETMRRALDLDEQRLAKTPEHARVLTDVAISLSIMGRMAIGRGDVAAAVAYRERTLAIRKRLVAADPQNVDAQSGSACRTRVSPRATAFCAASTRLVNTPTRRSIS